MPGALTLIVFVATGEAGDATSQAMARATRSALGAESRVELREARPLPGDAQAVSIEEQEHADAIVELAWADVPHRQAKLRVHVARSGRWIARSIGFQASDAAVERGRTIGFAVASMLPEAIAQAEGSAAASGSDATAPASSAVPVTPGPPAPPPAPAPAPSPAVDRSIESPRWTPSVPSALPERVFLDVLALGGATVGGDGDALGGGLAAQWFAHERLALRLGGGARAGNVQTAQATSMAILGSAGAVFYPLRASGAHPLGVWLRADYVVQRQSMTHLSADDPSPVTLQRWLSGADALVGGDWRISRETGIVAGIGGEDVFSTTYVQVRGVTTATLPPLRGVAEAGFRLRF